MEWVRGREIGSGTFSTVYLATPAKKSKDGRRLPPLFAVKSCDGCSSSTSEKLLGNEHKVLTRLGRHPNIVRCYGRSSAGDLLLEYAPFGSLDRAGPQMPDATIRRYTRHVLRALDHAHSRGFAHCDIKPQNILLFGSARGGGAVAKVADFGLASRIGSKGGGFRGTPFYVSPEAVTEGQCGPACDVWALGCVVAEMASGRRALRMREGENSWRFMVRIGEGDEVPEVPDELPEEGKDFLSKCWARDATERWTAEMLLRHPFVANCDGVDVDDIDDENDEAQSPSESPRCHFEFAELDSLKSWRSGSGPSTVDSSSNSFSKSTCSWSAEEFSGSGSDSLVNSVDPTDSFSYQHRVESLGGDWMPHWDNSCSWINAR